MATSERAAGTHRVGMLAGVALATALSGAARADDGPAGLTWGSAPQAETHLAVHGLDNRGRVLLESDGDDPLTCHHRRAMPDGLRVAVDHLRVCYLDGALFEITVVPRPGFEDEVWRAAAQHPQAHWERAANGSVTARDPRPMQEVRVSLEDLFGSE